MVTKNKKKVKPKWYYMTDPKGKIRLVGLLPAKRDKRIKKTKRKKRKTSVNAFWGG